jgi:signal transduction histidine kinase
MILIVDDKQENLFSLQKLLQLNLYEVETAASGEDALKKVLKKEYSLIILDVQMPSMDGYEVAETLKGYSKTRNIPIIFLSAVNIDKRFITQGYASGGVDYITKPFDPELLLLKVKTFYRLSEQTRELKETQAALSEEIEIRKEAEKALHDVNQGLEEKVKERTRELLQANKELEISNSELQQYASLASHDLQEPLRKIITFSHIIDERYLVTLPDAKKHMHKVIDSAERMRNLINDLLNYSKLSTTVQFSETKLNIILKEAISDLELAIQEKHAILEVEDLPTLEIIPGQMRQVFQNILSNALKFSKKDQPPRIRIWGEWLNDLYTPSASNNAGNFYRLFIEDNGIGFNEMYLDKIFTIFQRLHGKQEYEGTGIGLAIVKKIIEKHDGLLQAKSKEGEGTTFIITLPAKQKTATPESALTEKDLLP